MSAQGAVYLSAKCHRRGDAQFSNFKGIAGKSEKRKLLVVVADFVNETGESRWEKQLGALLRSELDNSLDLKVMTEAKMQTEIKKLGKDKSKRINKNRLWKFQVQQK